MEDPFYEIFPVNTFIRKCTRFIGKFLNYELKFKKK